jgi:hypothetical protein
VQQAVTDGDMDPEVRRPGQALHVAGLQGGQQQAEAGDGHGERIEIDAGDRVECLLCDVAPIASRLVVRPLLDQAMKSSEQEVPRPAGRIDQPHFAITELVDGRRQRPVENELLDELGRLQQRIALARGLAQILVQVAEEAGVPARVGEVADQCPGIGGNLLPELHHRHRGVAADPQAKDRVVGAVEEGMQAGQGAGLAETPEEIVAIVLVWVHAKVGVMAVARQGQSTGLRRAAIHGRSTSSLSSMKRRKTQLSSQCTPAWVMTCSAQDSKVSAVRPASRAACHSACSWARSSGTSLAGLRARSRRSSSSRLSRRVRSASRTLASIIGGFKVATATFAFKTGWGYKAGQ